MKIFLFLIFTLEFVKISAYFAIKTFGFWFTLSSSKLKVFVPPAQKKIVYAPQSRFSGAGPVVKMRKDGV